MSLAGPQSKPTSSYSKSLSPHDPQLSRKTVPRDASRQPSAGTLSQLNLASQIFPWLLMSHDLSQASADAARSAKRQLDIFTDDLANEERTLAADKEYYQLNSEIRMFESLIPGVVSQSLPILAADIIRLKERCCKTISNIMQLSCCKACTVFQVTRSMLDDIEYLIKAFGDIRKGIMAILANIPGLDESVLVSTLQDLVLWVHKQLEILPIARNALLILRDNERRRQHMAVLLGEPYLLASYAISSRSTPRHSGYTISRYIRVTYSQDKQEAGYATVCVEGDGVHILELSNMCPVASHTIGPFAHFATPAVTRFDGPNASISYATVQNTSIGDDSSTRQKQEIKRWHDHLGTSTSENHDAEGTLSFPKPVKMLWTPELLPKHIIGLSPSGDVMVISDQSCTTSSVGGKSSFQTILLRSFVFEAQDCTFLPNSLYPADSVVVLCFVTVLGQLRLRITPISAAGKVGQTLDCPLGRINVIADISCEPSGYTTVLTHQGIWHLFRLSHDAGKPLIAKLLEKPLHITGLAFLTAFKSDEKKNSGSCVMSVGQSFVLLAAFLKGSTSDIVFLLWDVQFSVVLGSQMFSLPSSLVSKHKIVPNLDLVFASRSVALLVISPHFDRPAPKQTDKSAVYVVPLTLPSSSTVALAMGKAKQTEAWLQTPSNVMSGEDQYRRSLVQTLQKLLKEDRPEEAEKTFLTWLEEERVRNERTRRHTTEYRRLNENKGAVQGDFEEAAKYPRAPIQPLLSYTFVSALLRTVLSTSRTAYSRNIIAYLLERRAVGNEMVDKGLLAQLRERNDWDSILSALEHVSDLPENDVLHILAYVVQCHRQRYIRHEDAMQIEITGIPALQPVLARVLDYRMSPPAVRLALKRHFSDAQDIVCLLEVLADWLQWWSKDEADLLEQNRMYNDVRIPLVSTIVIFIQNILDAQYLLLLQYKSSHDILRSISEMSNQHLSLIGDLDPLQGPLEVFARAKLLESAPKRLEYGDQRRKRKEAFEAAELAIGQYQIENLTL